MILSLGFMICPPPGLTSTEKKREYRINWLFQADLCQSFYSKERCSHSLPRVHIPRTARGSSLWEISAGEHSTMILPLYTNFLLYLFVHFFNFKYSRTHCDIKIYTTDEPSVICMDFIPWNIFQLLLNITVLCMP